MKKSFLSLLCFLVICCLGLPSAFTDSSGDKLKADSGGESIAKAYEYPVQPITAGWSISNSTAAKVKASQIPAAILNKLTTSALVETVLHSPLMVNMYAFNTRQQGYNTVYGAFNGLQELAKREDAIFELEQYKTKLQLLNSTDSKAIVQNLYIDTLIEAFSSEGVVVTPFYTHDSATIGTFQ
ncbi:hypothetical protein ACFQMJ_34220 [Cohnella cellulosilytica]|uniref:Uncharacterized protein n=2 Tax=Cohnella cellulosilytica TaxID=986710 RepID=A0ABW2FKB0_9BACL